MRLTPYAQMKILKKEVVRLSIKDAEQLLEDKLRVILKRQSKTTDRKIENELRAIELRKYFGIKRGVINA